MDPKNDVPSETIQNPAEAAQVQNPTITTAQNTPNPVIPPVPVKKTSWVLYVVAFVILAIIGGSAYFFYPLISQMVTDRGVTQNEEEAEAGLPNYWINCSDIREIIQDGGDVYFACPGGVLVLDRNSGEIKKQISQANGLGNAITTSLVKNGRILYIGTQDGFTKYNLEDGTSKKISVNDGLPSGSNIVLEDDGDTLWVGTFDGVSAYDKNTERIVSYKNELSPASTKFSISDILATDRAVYFIVLANAYSPGSVARYDKITKKWESFGPEVFGETGQYARIDFNTLMELDGKIYTGEHRSYWVAEDKEGTSWSKVEGVVESISRDQGDENVIVRVFGTDKSGLLIVAGHGFYRYIPSSGKIETILKDKDMYGSYTFFDLDNLGNGWLKTFKNDAWLTVISFADGSTKNISLVGRPSAFSRLIALVDQEPILVGDTNLWKYSLGNGMFEKIFDFSGQSVDLLNSTFLPVFGTSKALLFEQSCGMGCSFPNFYILDYKGFKSEKVVLPKKVEDLIQVEAFEAASMGSMVVPIWQSPVEGLFAFEVSETTNASKYIIYNISVGEWTIVSTLPEGGEKLNTTGQSKCNQSYVFEKNGSVFAGGKCSDVAENEKYRWEIVDDKVVQIEKNTNAKSSLTPPATDAEYSPFENFNIHTFSKLVYADGFLWVLSNRGLASYDPVNASWTLYDIKNGLTRNKVQDLLVGSKYLWVISEWSGLSAIPR